MSADETINAFPSKSFFIKTLVKDIHLVDAILDLIDNSIDSYIRSELQDRKKVSIYLSKDNFVIEDNCGGMSKDQMAQNVFKFGSPATSSKGRTIGVYGIGLKRSIFKMGENILIETDDKENSCSVLIEKEWLEDEDNWELQFNTIKESEGDAYTKITIKQLFANISAEIENPVFENLLRNRIKQTYSIFIEEKLDIFVNDKPIEAFDFRFLYDGENFIPFHKKYKYCEVDVEIYAGYSTDEQYGWYIFCNDRLVVRNDTSYNTGWGGLDGYNYHYPEDNVFLGLVFFRSEIPLSLPWQTTKENIQYDSPIYRTVQVEMRSITKSLVSVIRLTGRTQDPITMETIGKAFFEDYSLTSRKNLVEETDEKVPAVKGETVYDSIANIPKVTTIQYTKEKDIVKKVKKQLGNEHMTNKKMGLNTFEYYVSMEEVEDE